MYMMFISFSVIFTVLVYICRYSKYRHHQVLYFDRSEQSNAALFIPLCWNAGTIIVFSSISSLLTSVGIHMTSFLCNIQEVLQFIT